MSLPLTGVSILFALLLIFLTATVSLSSIFSYTHNSEEKPALTKEVVGAQSIDTGEEMALDQDSSVANIDEGTNLYTEIPGVGAIFSNMLDSLINLTKNSENRFQSLAHHLPLVFPDLYKVLITL